MGYKEPKNIYYEVSTELNLVHAKAWGCVNFLDVLLFVEFFSKDPLYNKSMDIFFDGLLIDSMTGDLSDYQNAAILASDNELFNTHAKTALVIPDNSPSILAYAQGYELMVSESKLEHRIFTESALNEALAFLALKSAPMLLNDPTKSSHHSLLR